jgi:cytochrome c-type biogenesis protein CcmF
MVGFLILLLMRLPQLRSDNQLDNVLSRETSYLTQNVLFVLLTATTLLGTLFRPISEWVTGNKISLNAPYFERVNGPIMVLLVLLMGIAPLLAWRRSSPATLLRNFTVPTAAALVSLPMLWLLGNRSLLGIGGLAVLVFVFVGICQEYVRGVMARRRATGESAPRALRSILARNGRRYGGYIVHLGVLMIGLGVIGNGFYQSENQANLRLGESITVANWRLTYRELLTERGPNYTAFTAAMDLERNGRPSGEILPKKLVYDKSQQQPMTEVGLRPRLDEDVYVVLAGFEDNGDTASVKVYVNPLMTWMWLGVLVIVGGVLVAAWPRAASRRQVR